MRRTESQWKIVPNCNLSEGPKMSNPKRSVHEVRAGSLCQSFKIFEIESTLSWCTTRCPRLSTQADVGSSEALADEREGERSEVSRSWKHKVKAHQLATKQLQCVPLERKQRIRCKGNKRKLICGVY